MSATAIRTGQSCAADARVAVREFHAAVMLADPALVTFFCSSLYDLDALADELNRLFVGVPVLGCTTAGEIGPGGYLQHSIAGASFPADSFTVATALLPDLEHFEISRGEACAQALLADLERQQPRIDPASCFALLLIDGLSLREETVVHVLQHQLGQIALVGGSAGDDRRMQRTQVFHGGRFHDNGAVVALVATSRPFQVFKTQHFVRTAERLVVTEADPSQRIVREINGYPAAQEYARILGIDVADLDPNRFSEHPVVVLIDGSDYVRSIQKANPDGSLTFYSAIDAGLVLRVAHGVDLIRNVEETFARIRAQIGPPELVLACDCILRNLEVTQNGSKARVGDVFRANKAVGLSTYGEQVHGLHVNQTLTGIAIGAPRSAG
ncbi:MAG: nitric oxide-sensing protein NosP [Sinimarinibacterium sp.]|jgi:hypothetical protein